MRVLWITNIIFPGPSKVLGLPAPVVGGWMLALAKQLNSFNEIILGVATTYHDNMFRSLDSDKVLYYLIPSKPASSEKSKEYWRKLCDEFKPDIIHIHGTENAIGLDCIKACPSLNYIVSIQGIVSLCAKYYYADISKREIISSITLRDLVLMDTIFHGKKKFESISKMENEYFLKLQHFSGRTRWDYVHSKAVNPSLTYHFCNESLRDSFYEASKWRIDHKTDFSIFLSQSSYPLKGLHQVLKAVALLKKDYPGIKIRVAGKNIIGNNNLKDRIMRSGYGAYIRRLIRKLKLDEIVVFTGNLNEEQMAAEYRNAHVFICPSSIENSPNSLGEAQLIGLPSIASHSGGIPDMIIHNESGLLYNYEDIEMLAYYIRRIFEDDTLALKLSEAGIKAASVRHNRLNNTETMISIYRKVINEQNAAKTIKTT